MTTIAANTAAAPAASTPPAPLPDHPALGPVKSHFAGQGLKVAEFRGQITIVASREKVHQVLKFLKEDPRCAFDFCCDVAGIDYLGYPEAMGRFAVVYNLISTTLNHRLFVKTYLDPTLDPSGTLDDPGLHTPSACDLWSGCNWPEREVYDLFGIRFDNHPDLRRILLWEKYPAHPLRKDYPLTGRGERESYRVIDRESA